MVRDPPPAPGPTLEGIVEDGDARPIGGAEVSFDDDALVARTAADGSFALRTPAGREPRELVIREGARVHRVAAPTLDGERARVVAIAPDAVPLRILSPATAPVPTRFGWLAMRATLAGLVAAASGDAGTPRFAVAGLQAGTWAIAVWGGPFLPALAESITLDGRVAARLVTLELSRRGAAVAGRAFGAGRKLLAKATVEATPIDPAARLLPARASCTCDAGGRYRVEGLSPGRYVLRVTPLGEPEPFCVEVALAPREERALDLVRA